jgi:hypothetical protein
MSLLDEYIDKAALAKELGTTARTLERYMAEPDGLPSTVISGRVYFRIHAVKAWLATRERRPNPRRGRAA